MSVHTILKALRLRCGDTVGVVSPSWGGAGAFPHRVQRGVEQLVRLGLEVKFGRHALNQRGFTSDTAENRVSDLHDMFRDPEVRLILSAIGGDHSCHLLRLFDFALPRQYPKLFMGYSDTTVLNIAIWQATRLVTFNGPALLTDFAECPEMLDYTRRSFLDATFEAQPFRTIGPAARWTEETLDWSAQVDLTRPRTLTSSDGWTWLKQGVGEGVLIGGCLESLQHLRGTRFWPDWKGAIFFFETSEQKPSPATVDGMLMDYENMGVFENLCGMLVGRPMRYSAEEKRQLREIILARTERYDFPIVADMDFGHTSPQLTIPIGCRARIDSSSRSLELLEPAVS
jgi:muramoyltetrapeptide carboxypeptidase LdcA involved in peptidoglycan recycling